MIETHKNSLLPFATQKFPLLDLLLLPQIQGDNTNTLATNLNGTWYVLKHGNF